MLPMLAFWVETVAYASGICPVESTALLALTDMVEAFAAIDLGITTPDLLRDRIRTFLLARKAAGWQDVMIPKFHWLLHFPANSLNGNYWSRASYTNASTSASNDSAITCRT